MLFRSGWRSEIHDQEGRREAEDARTRNCKKVPVRSSEVVDLDNDRCSSRSWRQHSELNFRIRRETNVSEVSRERCRLVADEGEERSGEARGRVFFGLVGGGLGTQVRGVVGGFAAVDVWALVGGRGVMVTVTVVVVVVVVG